jgi:hypothetical protein
MNMRPNPNILVIANESMTVSCKFHHSFDAPFSSSLLDHNWLVIVVPDDDKLPEAFTGEVAAALESGTQVIWLVHARSSRQLVADIVINDVRFVSEACELMVNRSAPNWMAAMLEGREAFPAFVFKTPDRGRLLASIRNGTYGPAAVRKGSQGSTEWFLPWDMKDNLQGLLDAIHAEPETVMKVRTGESWKLPFLLMGFGMAAMLLVLWLMTPTAAPRELTIDIPAKTAKAKAEGSGGKKDENDEDEEGQAMEETHLSKEGLLERLAWTQGRENVYDSMNTAMAKGPDDPQIDEMIRLCHAGKLYKLEYGLLAKKVERPGGWKTIEIDYSHFTEVQNAFVNRRFQEARFRADQLVRLIESFPPEAIQNGDPAFKCKVGCRRLLDWIDGNYIESVPDSDLGKIAEVVRGQTHEEWRIEDSSVYHESLKDNVAYHNACIYADPERTLTAESIWEGFLKTFPKSEKRHTARYNQLAAELEVQSAAFPRQTVKVWSDLAKEAGYHHLADDAARIALLVALDEHEPDLIKPLFDILFVKIPGYDMSKRMRWEMKTWCKDVPEGQDEFDRAIVDMMTSSQVLENDSTLTAACARAQLTVEKVRERVEAICGSKLESEHLAPLVAKFFCALRVGGMRDREVAYADKDTSVIYFPTHRYRAQGSEMAELKQIAASLKTTQGPLVLREYFGNGGDGEEAVASHARFVRDYLVEAGVDARRITLMVVEDVRHHSNEECFVTISVLPPPNQVSPQINSPSAPTLP